MIACFDAKYTYWFWRPHQAIPRADEDPNAATVADPSWRPLRTTPNFPEYPSAHACHTTAVAEALQAFSQLRPGRLESRTHRGPVRRGPPVHATRLTCRRRSLIFKKRGPSVPSASSPSCLRYTE